MGVKEGRRRYVSTRRAVRRVAARIGVIAVTAVAGVSCGQNASQVATTMPQLSPRAVLGGGDKTTVLYRPSAVAFDRDDRLWIVDRGNHRVVALDVESGAVREQIGGRGEGPGEFDFGRSAGRIAVRGDVVAVLEPIRQRVSVFNKKGDVRSIFNITDSAYAIALHEDGIYLAVATERTAEVREYGLDGVERGVLGGLQIGSGDGGGPVSRFLLFSHVGVISERSVIQTFRAWPLIRRYGVAPTERWFDFSWLGDMEIAEKYRRPRSYLSEEAIPLSLPEELRPSVFFDITCRGGRCLALLAYGVIQVFTETLEPGGVAQLWKNPETGAFPARDVAVTDDGRMLCTADTDESVVRCYEGGDIAY